MEKELVSGMVLPDRIKTKRAYDRVHPLLEETLQSLSRCLRQLLEGQGHSPTIKYRVKRFDNYFDKLVKLGKRPAGEELSISDLLGLRVVCPFLEDLEVVEGLISQNFEVIELERKGERHSFREFGYDSVHMLIRVEPVPGREELPHTQSVCEVQLRTILQDAWAEVEHELIYKSDIALPNLTIKRKLASLNASLTLSDLIFQEIRDYQKEVRAQGLKRRQSVEEILGANSAIAISQPHRSDLESGRDEEVEPPTENIRGLEKSMLKALEAHSNKDFGRAIQIYTRILPMKLESSMRSLVYNHRGMALFALSEYDRAIKDFSKAIRFDRENARAYTNRGLVYRVWGDFNRSLADYDVAIRVSPGRLDGYWGRAQTCFEMKLFSKALSDCQKVLGIKADFSPAEELIKTIHQTMF